MVFRDRKGSSSEYRVLNPKQKKTCKISIDDVLIKTKQTRKCDYGLWVDNNRMILIELKGTHVDIALEQLFYTHLYFAKHYAKENFRYSFRIVSSRVSHPNHMTKGKNRAEKGKRHKGKYRQGDRDYLRSDYTSIFFINSVDKTLNNLA